MTKKNKSQKETKYIIYFSPRSSELIICCANNNAIKEKMEWRDDGSWNAVGTRETICRFLDRALPQEKVRKISININEKFDGTKILSESFRLKFQSENKERENGKRKGKERNGENNVIDFSQRRRQ